VATVLYSADILQALPLETEPLQYLTLPNENTQAFVEVATVLYSADILQALPLETTVNLFRTSHSLMRVLK
jgi:hypothetical protein